jgi:hypothetical protein
MKIIKMFDMKHKRENTASQQQYNRNLKGELQQLNNVQMNTCS